VLCFAKFVSHLDQELELQLRVTGKHVFQDCERHPKQVDIGHGLNRVHIEAVFCETEDVFSEKERHHRPFTAWQIAKGLHDAMTHDEDRFGRRVLAVDNGPSGHVQAGPVDASFCCCRLERKNWSITAISDSAAAGASGPAEEPEVAEWWRFGHGSHSCVRLTMRRNRLPSDLSMAANAVDERISRLRLKLAKT
jgi:hypothetical protein